MSLDVNASPKQQLKQCTEYIYLILNKLYALQSSLEKKKSFVRKFFISLDHIYICNLCTNNMQGKSSTLKTEGAFSCTITMLCIHWGIYML